MRKGNAVFKIREYNKYIDKLLCNEKKVYTFEHNDYGSPIHKQVFLKCVEPKKTCLEHFCSCCYQRTLNIYLVENGQEKFIGKTVYIKATDRTLCGIFPGKTDGHDILD